MQPILEPLLKIAVLVAGLMTAAAYLVLVERWIAAWVQDRLRAESRGDSADEDPHVRPGAADRRRREAPVQGAAYAQPRRSRCCLSWRRFRFLSPRSPLLPSSLSAARSRPRLFPASWGITAPVRLEVAPNIDVGMIYVFAVGSIAVYGVVLGGWASNNKYSFLGGMRSSAQLISYELPLGLGILGVVAVTGSLRLDAIIAHQAQSGVWNVLDATAGLRRLLRGRLRRGRPAALRSARGRAGARRRLPHRILRHENDDVHGGRVPAHDHGLVADRDPLSRRLALVGPDRLGRGDRLDRGPAAGDRAAGESDGRHLVLHARPLELAAVPLRPTDGHRLEGDDSLGAGEFRGCGRLDGVRR